MKSQRGQAVFYLICIIGVIGVSMILDSMSCKARWKDSNVLGVQWGPIQGCRVKTEIGWIPEDRVREVTVQVKPKE